MGILNPTHLLFLVVIIALVFGSSKVPGMARSAGKHAREAKDGVDSFKQELNLGEGNPISEVVETVRSANPKTIVKNAAKNVVSPAEATEARCGGGREPGRGAAGRAGGGGESGSRSRRPPPPEAAQGPSSSARRSAPAKGPARVVSARGPGRRTP